MKTHFLSLVLFTFLISSSLAQEKDTGDKIEKYRARIEVQKSDSTLMVQGKFLNNTPDTLALNYELVAERTGKSGRSATRQSGAFQAVSSEEVDLSKTTINISPEDYYKIKLQVFDTDNIIAQDSVIFGSANTHKD